MVSETLTGLEYLPRPIIDYLRRSVHERPKIPHVYHVTELLYCLRKAYYRRKFPDGNYSLKSLWNIHRGSTFDGQWSPLFEVNQETFTVHRGGVTIQGTFDFLWVDQDEPVLYDLKMPASTYYKKQSGAGPFYVRQVQAYLAMAHANGEYLDVHRGRILMLAEDLVIEEVAEDAEILDYLWSRAFKLDHALSAEDPSTLMGPEESWECSKDYCESSEDFRREYCQ